MNKGITKAQIQFIKDLQQKEGRKSNGLFIVEGEKLVRELLASPLNVHSVYHTNLFEPPRTAVKSFEITDKELDRISALTTPNKVLALAHIPEPVEPNGSTMIYCSKLQDPGNAGTIFRIADWFGISSVILSHGSVEMYAPKVVQASMGAVFRLSLITDDESDSVLLGLKRKGYTIVGADMEGTPLPDFKATEKLILVMGSESHGIPENIKHKCDNFVTIPRLGKAESLNVGVACGIICNSIVKG